MSKLTCQDGLESIRIGSVRDDVRIGPKDQPNYKSCPANDRARNDGRISSLDALGAKLRVDYPNCKIYYFLRGPRIASRYKETRLLNGQGLLDRRGNVATGDAWKTIFDKMKAAQTANVVSHLQPQPSGLPGHNTGRWSNIIFTKDKGGKYIITPTYIPAHYLPRLMTPHNEHLIRVVIDTCIFEGREEDLLKLVGLYDEGIQMTTIPQVMKELKAGEKDGARLRMKWMREILDRKPYQKVTLQDVAAKSKPKYYAESKLPTQDDWLTGDLAIRQQLGRVIQALEGLGKNTPVVLFVTQDFGCGELMRAIGTEKAVYIVLRVDMNVKGKAFLDMVYNTLRPWLKI
jgi:hypothetical protein